MITEFSVSNFRSISDEMTLRLYTYEKDEAQDNAFEVPGVPYRFLKTVGMYGANASGKSNLLLAYRALQFMIRNSSLLHEQDAIPCYDPCAFCEKGKPSVFEIEFTAPYNDKPTRFIYKLAFTDREIVEEGLSVFFTNRESLLFVRKGREAMSFGAAYKGGARNVPCFPNQAFLSVAAHRPDTPPFIRAVASFLTEQVQVLRSEDLRDSLYSSSDVDIWKLLSHIDIGVSDVRMEERNVDEESLGLSNNLPRQLKDRIVNSLRNRVMLKHTNSEGASIDLDMEQESDGTRKMIQLLPRIIEVILHGGVLMVDELDNSMHPFMAEMVVRLMNEPDVNAGQSQLVFTTHNANLLSADNMRRDQIWFAEKTDGVSRYYSLDDFDKKFVTPKSPYVKWYLEGRFGAVPSINYAAIVSKICQWRKNGGEHA